LWLSAWALSSKASRYRRTRHPICSASAAVADEIESEFGDIRDLDAISSSMRAFRPDIVIHMAAQPLVRLSYRDPVGTYATNVMGTVHVLEAARRIENLRAIVSVTTDKCYENKEWPWGYREDEPMGGPRSVQQQQGLRGAGLLGLSQLLLQRR
jgi:CDP-glucose 4,6-dehydratase